MVTPNTALTRVLKAWFWALCLMALVYRPAHAQMDDQPKSKTESPYFQVQSSEPTVDALPLKSTRVDVRVSGVIADVTVIQTYRNEGQRAIEAKYVFPGSTRAAVHGMNVRVADRLISADIREKQQAQTEYDQAKEQGKTAALLEQHRPNVFQMNVANILPGDQVLVELHYTELLVPLQGQYQFVFPTVVGPRYNTQASEKWVFIPYFSKDQEARTLTATATFDIQVQLHMPIGLKEVSSPSHALRSQGLPGHVTAVGLSPTKTINHNKDFILNYRLAGDQIESGLLLHKGSSENFFLAMIEPPKAPAASAISPREYIFVVDISGSMHGFPLDTAKTLLRELIGNLRASDRFNVLLFSGSNRFLNEQSVPATSANIEQAIRIIDQAESEGNTELIPALKRVYAQPKTVDMSRTVVVVTDGYVTVEREAFELVRTHLSQANVFAFGIGSSVNRHLMEGLARAGMGEPFIITQPAQAAKEAQRFRAMIDSPVMTSVKVRFEGLEVYDVEPLHLPDLLAQRPVIVFGKWRGQARGKLVVGGQGPGGPIEQTLLVQDANQVSDNPALRQLWARQRIASLSDQEALEGGQAQAQAITQLGLQYNLLTAYTSFIAIDQLVRNPNAANTAIVNQPVPLPQGVGNTTLGAHVPSTPEPTTWAAMAMTLLVLLRLVYRRRTGQA
jgi:Ca-activated chloride channel homolog